MPNAALPPALDALLTAPGLASLGPERRAGTMAAGAVAQQVTVALQPLRLLVREHELIRALLLLWHDHFDEAHTIAQAVENPDGSFVHAILHRREPDAWNAKYWWRRVGAHPAFTWLERTAGSFLEAQSEFKLHGRLLPDGHWDAFAFVDECEAARTQPDRENVVKLLQEIQRLETQALLTHLLHA